MMLFKTSIKYPITFNLNSGVTDLDDLTTSINRCIALILTSGKGELLGDPEFGSRLYELLFNQYSDTLESEIKQEIVNSISQFESRVSITENNITIKHVDNADRNEFAITISYTIYGTNKTGITEIYMREDLKVDG
jgi:phage baseplate assembly protein W